MTDFIPAAPAGSPRRFGLGGRLQAAMSAFLSPERVYALSGTHGDSIADHAGSLADALALPPDWQAPESVPSDILSLSLLPFSR